MNDDDPIISFQANAPRTFKHKLVGWLREAFFVVALVALGFTMAAAMVIHIVEVGF